MRLFEEHVSNSSTGLPFNILQVEDFSEIFFEVYEVKIGDEKYPVEKISEYYGNPVVAVPIVSEKGEILYPFVLILGEQNIIFNQTNTEVPNSHTPYIDLDNFIPKKKVQRPVGPRPVQINEGFATSPDDTSILYEGLKKVKKALEKKADITFVEHIEDKLEILASNDNKLNRKFGKKINESNEVISEILNEKADIVDLEKTQKHLDKLKSDTRIYKKAISKEVTNLTEEVREEHINFRSYLGEAKRDIKDISVELAEKVEEINTRISVISENVENRLNDVELLLKEQVAKNINEFIIESSDPTYQLLKDNLDSLNSPTKDRVTIIERIDNKIDEHFLEINRVETRVEDTLLDIVNLGEKVDLLQIALAKEIESRIEDVKNTLLLELESFKKPKTTRKKKSKDDIGT